MPNRPPPLNGATSARGADTSHVLLPLVQRRRMCLATDRAPFEARDNTSRAETNAVLDTTNKLKQTAEPPA